MRRAWLRWRTAGRPHPIVDFSDTKKAYCLKSFSELLRHYLLYKMFGVKALVKHSDKLLRWSERMMGRRLFEWAMHKTVYGQFVGGDSLTTLRPRVAHLSLSGVHSILDYAVEEDVPNTVVMETRLESSSDGQFLPVSGDTTKEASARTYMFVDEPHCDENKEHFLSCIKTAAEVTEHGRPFAAIKLTGLGRVEFLLRLSKAVRGVEEVFTRLAGTSNVLHGQLSADSLERGLRDLGVTLSDSEVEQLFDELDMDNSGAISYHEWLNRFQPSRSLHRLLRGSQKLQNALSGLSEEDVQQMRRVVSRARELAESAGERGVGLMVDAEQTYFQPAIRHIVVNILMPSYNVGAETVVYNTQQCYLKDAERSLLCDLALSDAAGFSYGVKLVRGAYLSQEREKAATEGYPDPIWPDKASTDTCYNSLLRLCIQRAGLGTAHIMVASHNKQSIQHALTCMTEVGLSPSTRQVVFGQLLGMCDHLTLPLGQAGYQAYKYVPYGPVAEVLPYLVRRAHENSSLMNSQSALEEQQLVRTELLRRLNPFN